MIQFLWRKFSLTIGTKRAMVNQMFERMYAWRPAIDIEQGLDAQSAVAILRSVPPGVHIDGPCGPNEAVSLITLPSGIQGQNAASVFDAVTVQAVAAARASLGNATVGVGLVAYQPGAAFACQFWVNLGNARVLIWLSFSLLGNSVQVGIVHVVLVRQEWMDDHSNDDWDIVELSQRYEEHFGLSGAYGQVCDAFRRLGHTHYGGGGWRGYGTGTWGGKEIMYSNKLHSFVRFCVGDHWIPQGSHVGQILANVNASVAKVAFESQRRLDLPPGFPTRSISSTRAAEPRITGRVLEQED